MGVKNGNHKRWKLSFLDSRLGIQKRIRNQRHVKLAEVLLLSFPKCGRTWLRLMIGRAIELHYGLKNINTLIIGRPGMMRKLACEHPDIPKILIIHDDFPHKKMPHQLTKEKMKYKNKKVVFLVRDPRDVVVSNYFQNTKRSNVYTGTISEFLYEKFGSIDTLIRFYNIWAENRHVPKQFLLVRYEDIHLDPKRELRRVLDFINLESINDEIINESINYASFDNMLKMEKKDTFKREELRPKQINDRDSFKTRKGKVGGFIEYFNEEEIQYLNQRISETLSDFYFSYKTPVEPS